MQKNSLPRVQRRTVTLLAIVLLALIIVGDLLTGFVATFPRWLPCNMLPQLRQCGSVTMTISGQQNQMTVPFPTRFLIKPKVTLQPGFGNGASVVVTQSNFIFFSAQNDVTAWVIQPDAQTVTSSFLFNTTRYVYIPDIQTQTSFALSASFINGNVPPGFAISFGVKCSADSGVTWQDTSTNFIITNSSLINPGFGTDSGGGPPVNCRGKPGFLFGTGPRYAIYGFFTSAGAPTPAILTIANIVYTYESIFINSSTITAEVNYIGNGLSSFQIITKDSVTPPTSFTITIEWQASL